MNQAATGDSPLWYAVCTTPKEEERAETNLRAWGPKTFMPKSKELEYSRRSVKLRTAIKKLFLMIETAFLRKLAVNY